MLRINALMASLLKAFWVFEPISGFARSGKLFFSGLARCSIAAFGVVLTIFASLRLELSILEFSLFLTKRSILWKASLF